MIEAFELGKLIRGTTKNIKKYINKRLKPYNLSEGHFEYFINIYHNQGINQKQLGASLNQGKAAVTKAVQRLLNEELIYRKTKETDQRNYGLYITEKGQNYIELFHDISGEVNSKVLSSFTDEEIQLLYKLAYKMHENTKTL